MFSLRALLVRSAPFALVVILFTIGFGQVFFIASAAQVGCTPVTISKPENARIVIPIPIAQVGQYASLGGFENRQGVLNWVIVNGDGPRREQARASVANIMINICLEIINAPPTATFEAVASGQQVELRFTNSSDPSQTDNDAGFTYSYDCDTSTAGVDAIGITSTTYVCTYASPGTYSVMGTIRDKDHGMTALTNTTVDGETEYEGTIVVATPTPTPSPTPTPTTPPSCPLGLTLPQTTVWSDGQVDVITLNSGAQVTYDYQVTLPTDGYRVVSTGQGVLTASGESFTIAYPVIGEWGLPNGAGTFEAHTVIHLQSMCGYQGHDWDRWYHDSDNDRVVNDLDNCWDIANSDQLDADLDGQGDACDLPPTAVPSPDVTTSDPVLSVTEVPVEPPTETPVEVSPEAPPPVPTDVLVEFIETPASEATAEPSG